MNKSKCCNVEVESHIDPKDGTERQYCGKCKWSVEIPIEERYKQKCKYCYGKGTYSRFKAGGTFGDSFDGYIYIEPEIEIHPCTRCQKVESFQSPTSPSNEECDCNGMHEGSCLPEAYRNSSDLTEERALKDEKLYQVLIDFIKSEYKSSPKRGETMIESINNLLKIQDKISRDEERKRAKYILSDYLEEKYNELTYPQREDIREIQQKILSNNPSENE